MSDGFDQNNKAIGLYRHPNNLNSPDGALLAADECVITRENQIDRRKGYSLCNTGLPLATPQQLFVSNGVLYANIDSKLYYEDGSCNWVLVDHNSTVGAFIKNMYVEGDLIYYVEFPTLAQSIHSISTFKISNKYISPISGDTTNTNFVLPYPISTNGTAYVSKYSGPYGFTAQGNYLYVADSGSSTVRRVDKTTGTSTTFAGLIGTSGTADGIGAAARFKSVQAICSDSTYLWLIDVNSFIIPGASGVSCNFRKIEISTQTVTTITSPAYYGDPGHTLTFAGSCGWTTSGHDYCYFTHTNFFRVGVSTGGDPDGWSIVRINKNTGVVDQNWSGLWDTSGFVNGTAANTRYGNLYGIWGDVVEGYLYVCDGRGSFLTAAYGIPNGNQIIRKVSLTDGSSTTYAGTQGTPGYVDGIGTVAQFTNPSGIWGDSTYIWVADQTTIRRIERSTTNVVTYANINGTGAGGYVSYIVNGPT